MYALILMAPLSLIAWYLRGCLAALRRIADQNFVIEGQLQELQLYHLLLQALISQSTDRLAGKSTQT